MLRPICRNEICGSSGEGQPRPKAQECVLYISRCGDLAAMALTFLAVAWLEHRLGLTSWAGRFFLPTPEGTAMAHACTFLAAAAIAGAVWAVLHQVGALPEAFWLDKAAPDGAAVDCRESGDGQRCCAFRRRLAGPR